MDQPAFTKARFTRFENIPSESFPNHYNFVSYNQLESKVYRKGSSRKQKQPTLTDYIGCLIRVGDIQDVGNPNKNQSKIRRLDVENLNGDVLEITLWDEMAINFSMGRLRQNGTTSYLCYLADLRDQYTQRLNLNPPLQISKENFLDINAEKTKNRFPLSTLLQQNQDGYKLVRFTSEATITQLNTSRDWYYQSCSECNMKVAEGSGEAYCVNHGLQKDSTYRRIRNSVGNLLYSKRRRLNRKQLNPVGRIDFYFDDILDKPLQIAGASETQLLPAATPTQTPAASGSAQILTDGCHNLSIDRGAGPLGLTTKGGPLLGGGGPAGGGP
ncbi:nucleic acid-binding, OB-fold protein [Tanacetum coccineum]